MFRYCRSLRVFLGISVSCRALLMGMFVMGAAIAAVGNAPPDNALPAARPSVARTEMEKSRELGMAAYEEEDYTTAVRHLAEVFAISPQDAEVAGRLGFAAKETGAYEMALVALEAAVTLRPDEYYYWWWMADAQRLLGKYEVALKNMEKAQELAPSEQRGELQKYVAYTAVLVDKVPSWENFEQHLDFAERHRSLRRVRRQIAAYANALEVAPPFEPDDIEGLRRMGWVYQQMGQQYNYIEEPDVAFHYFLRAREYASKAKLQLEIMRNNQNMAASFRKMADRAPEESGALLNRAAAYWRESLAVAREINEAEHIRYVQGRYLETLAVARALDDLELVELREMNRKEVPWQGPVNEYSTAYAVVGEAICRIKEGDFAGARILLEMALPYFETSLFLSDYQRASELYLELARVYHAQGHAMESLGALEKATAKADQAREYIDADAFNRSAGERTLRRIAAARARAYLALNLPEKAFDVVEAYKTRRLLNLLGSRIQEDSARADAESERSSIERRIPMLEEDLAAVEGQSDSQESARIRAVLDKDRARLVWLQRSPAFISAQSLAFKPVTVATSESVKEALSDTTAILSYLFDEDGGILLAVQPGGIKGHLINKNQREISALAGTLAGASVTDSLALLAELYTQLIQPAEPLDPATMLLISPDAATDTLPFAALRAGGDWLLDRHEIVYCDSVSQALAQWADDPVAPELLRLSQGRSETPAFDVQDSRWPRGIERFSGAHTSVAQAVSDIQPAHVLHLKCLIDPLPPDAMLCPLVLDSDSPDRELPAAAVLGMKLPASLVTLQWKLMNSGQSLRGDILRVFAESLRFAGVRSLLTSPLEMPPEQAALFFSTFYNALPEGKTSALRAACDAVRQAYPQSLYWAGVMLRLDYR